MRALWQPGHPLPYWTVRARSNACRELAHICVTALARIAHWIAFYACGFVALLLAGLFSIVIGMVAAMRDLAVRCACICLLHPNYESCLTEFQPMPLRPSNAPDSPEPTAMF